MNEIMINVDLIDLFLQNTPKFIIMKTTNYKITNLKRFQ